MNVEPMLEQAMLRVEPHPIVQAIRMPPTWKELATVVVGTRCWFNSSQGLAVIAGLDVADGAAWLHVSVSRRSKTPSYEDMTAVKELVVGDALPAYHVWPKKSEHRNLHPNCLHLWAPVEKDPFPDFDGHRANSVAPDAGPVRP